MKQPSRALLKSIHENIDNHLNIEGLQAVKNRSYMQILQPTTQKKYYPWYRENDLLTNYNTIKINQEEDVIKFI